MRSRWRRLDVVLLNALLLPFLFWGLHAADTDTFFHLSSGRWMFENGRVMDGEEFSYVGAGRPWTNAHWLFQCALYGSWRLGGFAGVVALRGLLLVLTLNTFWWWIRTQTGGRRLETLAFGLLAFSLYLPRGLNARGHMVSYLFLVLLQWRLARFALGSRRFDPVVPLLCVAWANLHGVELPVVLAVIGVHAAAAFVPHLGTPIKDLVRNAEVVRWLVLLAAAALAFAASPFGLSIYSIALLSTHTEVLSQNAEMSGHGLAALDQLLPDLRLWSATVFNWTLLGGAALCAYWTRRRRWTALGCFLLGASLALYRNRFIPEFMILAVPFMAQAAASLRDSDSSRSRPAQRTWVLLAAYMVACVLWKVGPALHTGSAFRLVNEDLYPVGPVRFLEQHDLRGRVFANPTIAGYLTWMRHPSRLRIFMDMRAPEPFWAQDVWLYKAVGDTVPLASVVERYDVDLLLLDQGASLVAPVRAEKSPFALVWADQSYLLFVDERHLAGREHLRLNAYDEIARVNSGVPQGRPSEVAVAEARRLAGTWPGNHLAQVTLLWASMAGGRPRETLDRARALSEEHPRMAVYPRYMGLALGALGRSPEAVAALRESLDRNPDFLEVYAELARQLAGQSRVAEALEVMDELGRRARFRLSPADHVMLGWLRHRSRRLPAAADAYERALWQLSPRDDQAAAARHGLAAVQLDQGRPAPALALLDENERHGRPNVEAKLLRARALRMLGRTDEARALLERVAHDEAVPAEVRERAGREALR